MNKQAKLKSLMALIMMLLISAVFTFGDTPDSSDVYYIGGPADNSYQLNDTIFNMSVMAEAVEEWNITAFTCYHNATGTWHINQTITIATPLNSTDLAGNFTIDGVGDGTDYVWAISANYTSAIIVVNESNSTNTLSNLTWKNGTNMTLAHDKVIGVVLYSCNITEGFETILTGNYTFYRNGNIQCDSNHTDLMRDDEFNLCVNYTYINSTEYYPTTNRTINVEYPAPITLDIPTDTAWTNAVSTMINFTVYDDYCSGCTLFDCKLWDNHTGSFSENDYYNVINDTEYSTTHYFEEGNGTLWNIRCCETAQPEVCGFSNANRTINVDRTDPTVAVTFTNETWDNTGSYTFNYTITDAHPKNCSFYINTSSFSLLFWDNTTNTSVDDGIPDYTSSQFYDSNYTFIVGCYDQAGNEGNSTAYEVRMDTIAPVIYSLTNLSLSGQADKWWINFTTNELTNWTLWLDTFTPPTTQNTSNSSRAMRHNIIIEGLEENQYYFYNMTACDRAGNCNDTIIELESFLFPWKLLTGWSYWGIYEQAINFSDILVDSGADYVYWWNATGQDWEYATAGGSSKMEFTLGDTSGRNVVALYEGTNSTWARNTSSAVYHDQNFTVGHNFIRMFQNQTMGEIGISLLNQTDSNETALLTPGVNVYGLAGDLPYNMTNFHFSGYNNSGVTWDIDYIYNWSWNNNTQMTVFSAQEVVWLWSPQNLTWNGTKIIGNHSGTSG